MQIFILSVGIVENETAKQRSSSSRDSFCLHEKPFKRPCLKANRNSLAIHAALKILNPAISATNIDFLC